MAPLPWHGTAEDAFFLARLGPAARDAVLLLPDADRDPATGVARLLLEEQAACLGLRWRPGPPSPLRAPDPAAAVAEGIRAFLVAVRPPLDPSFLGRFLDAPLVADLRRMEALGAAVSLAVDGPPFRRRVDAVALEPEPWGDGWRLELGVRGC